VLAEIALVVKKPDSYQRNSQIGGALNRQRFMQAELGRKVRYGPFI